MIKEILNKGVLNGIPGKILTLCDYRYGENHEQH